MAEDSEKRFHAIMNKLFPAPPKIKPRPSATTTSDSSQLSSGITRQSLSAALAYALAAPKLKKRAPVIEESPKSSGGIMQVPLCRPWDREDLYKRLATFKSMTWFGKPEVVNALNCARRGWVNVETDIIACESCGARLLFSTPSTWAQHQVEKAALVFSLKLNNGHKLHCPWVDNACDETLTQFPPTSVVDLVDNYKKRFARLMQLVALPVISSTAIDYIKNPELEHFLDGSSTLELGDKSTNASVTECLEDESEANYTVLYYQAQKLISLCGWEPRLLPYIVDCKDRENESTRQKNPSVPLLKVPSGQASGISVYSSSISVYSSSTADYTDEKEDQTTFDMQYHPSSVVLDCRLCGASVGLWGFCTVPRPAEFIRLIGGSEVDGDQADYIGNKESEASVKNISSNENLVVGRENTSSSTAPTRPTSTNITSNLHLTIAGGPTPEKQNFRPIISLPVVGQNLRAQFSSVSQFKDQQRCNALNNVNNELRSVEGEDLGEKETPFCMENPVENIDDMVHNSSAVGRSLEGEFSAEAFGLAAGNLSTSQDGREHITSPSSQVVTGNGETSVNDASLMDMSFSDYLQQYPRADTISGKQDDGQGILPLAESPHRNIDSSSLGKDLRQVSSAKAMEFDPIRQHRHFCSWIASNVNSSPGWKQTLNALQRQKEFSSPLSAERPSSSLIKVDDPVASVKKLLTPPSGPSSKRKKFTHGST